MKWIFATITVWLLFVLSLSTWWMLFGLNTLDQLATGQIGEGAKILRQQKMLFYEGSFLAMMQILGGIGLFYFAFRMYKEKATTEEFFASFAHDLKTSLFRLQLFVEGHDDDRGVSPQALLGRTRHLQLNIENGLNSVIGRRKAVFMQTIDMSEFVADLHVQWPELAIQLQGSGAVRADKNALRSLFENLLHNSFSHGEAETVFLKLEDSSRGRRLIYSDDGKPFSRGLYDLGQRPVHSEKGSGFGLYLVRFWVRKMKGVLEFRKTNSGQLEVYIDLPEGP